MKSNRIIYLFLCVILIVLLTACNSTTQQTSSNTEDLQKQMVQLEERIEKLEEQQFSPTTEVINSAAEVEEEPQEVVTPVITKMELDTPLELLDFAEITITKATFTTKVSPPNPGSYHSYYEVKENSNIYLDTVLNIKSLLTSSTASDEFASVKVIYDGKYEYSSFSTIEERGGSDFTYTNITSIEPLKSGVIHYISELPIEASEDTKSIDIIITTNGEEYIYSLR